MPVDESPWLLLTLASLCVLSLAVWTAVGRRWQRGAEVVAWEPRQPVPWTGLHVLLAVLLWPLCGQAVLLLAQGFDLHHAELQERFDDRPLQPADLEPPPPMSPREILAFSLGSLLATAATMALLVGTAGATAEDLGVRPWRARDLLVGLAALFALLPVIYGIQAVMVHWFPSQHPVLRMLQDHPDPAFLLLAVGVAALVAPVAEEFLFRVVLQGWIEAVLARPPRSESPASRRLSPAQAGAVAVCGSSLPFALVHLAHGPDPIALFPLALALGFLYRRTHRLWAPVALHLGFNATSLLLTWLQMQVAAG